MLVSTNLSVSGPLSLGSVSSTTTSLSAMILEAGLVKSRLLGSMSLKGDDEYLPQIGLSFPNIFNLNTNILDFTNQSLTVSLANQTANTFLAAPNGLSGTPSFRAIIASDIPILNQNTTGNAATATALQTARTLTIGNTGKTFNGTSNVSWSLAEIGAQSILTNPITGTGTTNFLSKFTAIGAIGDSQIFDNGTNVGIGTTSLGAKLDVNGDGRFQTNLTIGLTTNNNGARTVFNGSTGGRSFQIANNWNVGGSFEITPSTTTSGSTFTTPALVVNGTTSNVGIGTTTPSELLDVNGAFVTRGVRVNNLGSGGFIDYNNGEFRFVSQGPNATTAGTYSFTVRESDLGGSVNAMVIGNTGNVGIGTTSPQARLDVRAQGALSTDIVFRVRNSTDTQNFLVVNGVGDVYNNGANGVNTNTFFGENVGRNTTGGGNTAIGINALFNNTTGASNTAIGNGSLYSNITANNNTAVGLFSLFGNTTGLLNTAIGSRSLQANISGSNNVAIGNSAARYTSDGITDNTISNSSIFLGANTAPLANNQTNQIVIGNGAIGLGSNSVVLGNDSIVTTALKGNAGIGNTSPTQKLDVTGNIKISNNNSLMWRNAANNADIAILQLTNTNQLNIGTNSSSVPSVIALHTNSTERVRISSEGYVGIGTTTAGARLDVIAQGALATDVVFRVRNSTDTANFLTVTGRGDVYNSGTSNNVLNTFFGYGAGRSITVGSNNSFFGNEAGSSNTTGGGNVFVGEGAGFSNTAGGNSTAVGRNALGFNTTGTTNTAFGAFAGVNINGNNNNIFGFNAARFLADGTTILTSCNESIFIGNLTKANDNSQSNQIVIGYNAIGLGSNSVVLGNDSIVTTALKGNVGIGTSNPLAKLHVEGSFVSNSPNANFKVDSTNMITAAVTSTTYGTGAGFELIDDSATFGFNPFGDFRGVRANYTEGVWFENESRCKLGLQPVDNNLWSEGNIIQVDETPSNKAEPVAWIKIFNNDNESFYFMPVYQ